MAEPISLILDTDIGSDIDDAVALAYLLKQPRCELLGITTVSGEPEKRAMLADAVCRAAGRDDIPVHVGTPASLLVGSRQPHAPQAEALTEQWPHQEFAKTNTAIAFLRDTIHARPGEITLLTIGPLTNIALLFTLDPEIPTLLKGLTMMGGQFYSRGARMGHAEWNIWCDPHAAEIVFRAPLPQLTAIGLDVTTQCVLPADECRRRFTAAGGALGLVGAMAEVWFRHVPNITFHDPLAAAVLFEPSLCGCRAEQVEVELVSPRAQGQTLTLHKAKTRPHQIAESVRAEAFFEHYFGVVGKNVALTVREYCIKQGFSENVINEGIPYLLKVWERTASRVADYNGWYREEYLNDLEARQILAELWNVLSEAERIENEGRLAAADAQFIANSIGAPECVWGATTEIKRGYSRQNNWWYYRLPKQIKSGW